MLSSILTRIGRVEPPVGDIDGLVAAGDEILKLVEIKHTQHVRVDDTGDTTSKRDDLFVYLSIELVVG